MEEARKQANLRSVQRCNKSLTDILATATHAVLYEFDAAQQSWQKNGTEGSLFLAASAGATAYSLIILNRNSTDNFHLAIEPTLQIQHQDPYLILRLHDEDQRILGIWFHNADERIAMYRILTGAVKALQEAPTQSTTTTPAVDATATAMAAVSLKSVLGIGVSDAAADATASATAPPNAPTLEAAPPEGGAPTLDKKSLQLALLSLIQDDRFLDLLHSQYLRVARSRAKKNQQQSPAKNGNP